jgi:hypothetical protein
MTYKELLEQLQNMSPDRLNDNVTVWSYWEQDFIPVCKFVENIQGSEILDTDVLDYGHMVLEVQN